MRSSGTSPFVSASTVNRIAPVFFSQKIYAVGSLPDARFFAVGETLSDLTILRAAFTRTALHTLATTFRASQACLWPRKLPPVATQPAHFVAQSPLDAPRHVREHLQIPKDFARARFVQHHSK